jgi:hypothetical protein
MSACCGQGVSNLMSQFKTSSTSLTNLSIKTHPHDFKPTMTTTQITPQTFTNTFTKTGFMKFTRTTQ